MRKGKKRFLAMLLAVGMILPNTSFVRAENDIGTTETTEVVTEVSTESGTEIPSDDVEVVLLDNNGNEVKMGDELPDSTEDVTSSDATEVVEDDSTEPDTDKVTEEETEKETEAETEEVTTEADSEEVAMEAETEAEKQPTFAQPVAGVDLSGLDFSSKELLVGTDNEDVFTWDTTVVSGYEGMYLTRYASVEETKNAYSYYYNKVEYVSPNIVFTVQDNEGGSDEGADLSNINQGNDAIANLNDMNTASTPTKTIAVIDTGINATDLVGAVSVLGGDAKDDHGHGTRIYNFIKEEYPSAKILSIKAMDAKGKAKASDICAAIQYAIESKVDVINLSFSAKSTEENSAVENAIEDAVKAGIVVVGAAGNNGIDAKDTIPGAVEKAVIVGACDVSGMKVATSNFGDTVDCYVVSESTSEATARYSAFYVSGNLQNEKIFADITTDSAGTNIVSELTSDGFDVAETKPKAATKVKKTVTINGKSYTFYIPSYIMLPLVFEDGCTDGAADRDSGWLGAAAAKDPTGNNPWRHIGYRDIPETEGNPNKHFLGYEGHAQPNGDTPYSDYDCGSYLKGNFGKSGATGNLKKAFQYVVMDSDGGAMTRAYASTGTAGVYQDGGSTGWQTFYNDGYRVETASATYSPSVNCMEPSKHSPSATVGDQFVLYPVKDADKTRTYANYFVSSGGNWIYVPYRTRIVYSGAITTSANVQSFLIGAYVKVPMPKDYYIAIQKEDSNGKAMMGVTFNLSFKDNDADETRTITVTGRGHDKSDGIWTGYYQEVNEAGTNMRETHYAEKAPDDTSIPHGVALVKLGTFSTAPTNVTVTENWKTTNYTKSGSPWANGKARLYTSASKYVTVDPTGYQDNTATLSPTVYTSISDALSNASKFKKVNTPYTYYIAVQKHDDAGNVIKGVTFDLSFTDNDAGATRTFTVNGAGTTKADGIYTGFYAKVDGTHITGHTTKYKDASGTEQNVPLGVGLIKLGTFANAPTNIVVKENWNTTNRVDGGTYSGGKAYLYNSSGSPLRTVDPTYYKTTSQKKDVSAFKSTDNALKNIASYDFINTRKWLVGIYKKDTKNKVVEANFDIYGTNTANATTGGTKIGTLKTSSSDGYGSCDVTDKYSPTATAGSGKYRYFYAVETSTAADHFISRKTRTLTVHAEKLTTADYLTWVNPDTIKLRLKKGSANTAYTKDNPNYSLVGAEYKVFTSSDDAQACAADPTDTSKAIGTLTVENNDTGLSNTIDVSEWMDPTPAGDGSIQNTTFWVAETKAGKNYLRSTEVKSILVTTSNDKNNPATVNVTDEPVNDPFDVEIIKRDLLTKSEKVPEGKTLAGAQFRVDFYAVDITTPNITATKLANDYASAKQSDYTTTITVAKDDVTGKYFAEINDVFPVGFITLTEIAPPKDYTLDGAKAYLQNDKSKDISGNLVFATSATFNATKDDYDGVVYHPNYPTINLHDETGAAVAFNIEVHNTPIRGDIQLTKVRISDDGPIANVEFEIENNKTHEKHSIFTDVNGNATTKNNQDAWFSKSDDDEPIPWTAGYGSLPKGEYTLTEKRSEVNKEYQLLPPIPVTINAEGVQTIAQADGKLYNVEMPRIETTAYDKATGTKTLSQIGTPQTVVDKIEYYNLRANSTYYLVGTLMIRHADGTYEPYSLDGTHPYTITSSAINTPTTWTKSEFECRGSYIMEFPNVVPEGHEGEYFVVYQKLYYNNVPTSDANAEQYAEYAGTDEKIFPVVHEDIENEDQTVRPGDVHTGATDGITFDHIQLAEGMVTSVDRVYYTGLTVGKQYTLKGTLHVTGYTWKDMNGNEIKTVDADDTLLDAAGQPVTAEKTFTATKADGYEDLEFTYDASLLNGETIVAFEDLYYNNMRIAFHADLKDEDQSVHYPNIHTTLYRAGTETWCEDFDENDITKQTTVDGSSQELLAEENAEVIDRVKYHNLLANRNYVIRGVLMDKDTNAEFEDADGKKVTVEYPFSTPKVNPVENTKTPNAAKFICGDGTVLDMSADYGDYLVDGYAEVPFPKFNAKGMEGKTLVAYEEVFMVLDDGTEYKVATHKDINAAEQTVVFPRIGTQAGVKETATTLVPIDGPVTINDTVHYEKLIPGKTYTFTARPVVKGDVTGTYKDGDQLRDKNGNVVEKEFEFVAPDEEGDVVVPITFDGYLLPVVDIVCYEDVSNYKGLKVAVHNDINDENQTVETCKISTTVKDNTTSDTDSLASEETIFTDTVYYEKLIPGLNYRLKGTLMVKSTNTPIEVNGAPLTTSVDFTPDDKVGQIDMTFPAFDAIDLALAGEDIVVFEGLYLITADGEEVYIAEHKDIDDEGQTIHIADVPKTTAEDSETEDHIADVDKDVTIIDHVEYKNLLIGKEYTVTGVLMVKETGEKLLVDGKEVTGKTTFTPTTRDGVVDVEFTFDASALEGQTIVVFEDVYRENLHVATHADINDEDQTVRFPKVKTKSEDAVTKENIGEANSKTSIVDTVSYWNVIPGKSYTVKGVLMVKETGEKLLVDGKEVTAEKTFKAEAADGTVELTFTFDASALAGQTLVVFEDLYYNGVHVGTHSDLYDEEQSEHHPDVHTTAKDKATDKHVGLASKTVTIVDTVKYKNLIPGKDYTIKGVLMDKDTGKEFKVNGKKVTAEKKFTAEKANGTEELEFTFDGSALNGKTIVVFEDLLFRKHRVATHSDLEDEGQTVRYPSVHTHVQDKTKKVQAIKNVTVYDDVKYDHLLVGKTYQLDGVLVDKQTGKPIEIDGQQITATKKFKADSEAGMVTMTFNFDASSLVKVDDHVVVEKRDVVVFERLSLVTSEELILIAKHEDVNDKDQTFEVTDQPTTGDSTPIKMLTILFILAITGAGVAVFFKKRKFGKKED